MMIGVLLGDGLEDEFPFAFVAVLAAAVAPLPVRIPEVVRGAWVGDELGTVGVDVLADIIGGVFTLGEDVEVSVTVLELSLLVFSVASLLDD